MKRHNTTKRRKQAFYLQRLDETQKQEYLTMVARLALLISRKLERQGKVKVIETCDGSFDTYYDADDSWKIIEEMFKKITENREAQRKAHAEIQRVKRVNPGARISLKLILLLLLSSMVNTADAKWTEWSSPPQEISKYDTIGAGLVASGLVVISDAIWFPPAGILGAGMIGCGLVTRGVGSAHRLVDHVRGVHPLSKGDAITEALGVVVPGTSGLWRSAVSDINTRYHQSIGEAPTLTFERVGPGLGENITPAIKNAITPVAEYLLSDVPPAERNAAIQSAASAAQTALEVGIEHAPTFGIGALGTYAEIRSLQKAAEKTAGAP